MKGAAAAREMRYAQIMVVVAFSLLLFALLRFVVFHSTFFYDDLDAFLAIKRLPLARFLVLPIDVHFVPLQRFFSYLVLKIDPLDFTLAVGVMAIFQILAVLLLYLLMQEIYATPYNLLVVGVYAVQHFLLPVLSWWSAGMHRLPYLFLAISSMYFYARWRSTGRWFFLSLSTLSFILAFGFYEKAVLIPCYLAGFELMRFEGKRDQYFRVNVGYLVAMLGMSMLYVLWYLLLSPVLHFSGHMSVIMALLMLKLQFIHLVAQLLLLRESLHGFLPIVAATLVFLVLLFVSLRKSRMALYIGVGVFWLFLNFAVIDFQSRSQVFGLFMALTPRYFYESFFLLCIVAAFIFRALAVTTNNHREFIFWALIALLYSGLGEVFGGHAYLCGYNASVNLAHVYMHRVYHEFDALHGRQVTVLDTKLPRTVFGVFVEQPIFMSKILVMRYQNISFTHSPAAAEYTVDAQGYLIRLQRPRS